MAEESKQRFVVRRTSTFIISDGAQILVDTVTGVNYLVVSPNLGGGVTPLLDSSGNVVIDK